MHEKQLLLRELAEKKIEEKRQKKEKKEMKECSFSPKLRKAKKGLYSSSESSSPIRYLDDLLIDHREIYGNIIVEAMNWQCENSKGS